MTAVFDRLFLNVSPCPNTGCWFWMGATTTQDYGRGWAGDDRSRGAHILFYEECSGPVPEGHELDHLCRVRRCCNPDHVTPVTHLVNVLRGVLGAARRAQTHCVHGHPLDGNNLRVGRDGKRACRTCARERMRAHRRRRAA